MDAIAAGCLPFCEGRLVRTQDGARCRQRSLAPDGYVRAANPQARREALTSRPLLSAAVGRAATSGNQTTLYLTPMHAEPSLIRTMIANVRAAILHLKAAAEPLPKLDRWRTLLACICQRIVGQIGQPIAPPMLSAPGQLQFSG